MLVPRPSADQTWQKSHVVVRVLKFLGGGALSILCLCAEFTYWSHGDLVFKYASHSDFAFKYASPIHIVGSLYGVMFGIMILIVEAPFESLNTLRGRLFEYFSFMRNSVSRAVFYVFVANYTFSIGFFLPHFTIAEVGSWLIGLSLCFAIFGFLDLVLACVACCCKSDANPSSEHLQP